MKSNPMFDHLLHGGDYNPEQWDEHVWDEDVLLMQEAHWNIATLPVFGWVTLQPDEETFRFEWFDRVLDKLHAGGIDACMATATASVPKWMTQKYPEILSVNTMGQQLEHGGRHIFCPNSPEFRRLSTTLVRKLAERYAQHPALKIWHVGNEYGGNDVGGRCHCTKCQTAFREWLQARYGDLDTLNARWDTAFWGHTYTNWEQIASPKRIGEHSIQALTLDYDRFQSESLLNCYRAEAAILREVTPNVPITTNMMGAFKPLNYHAWAKEVDVVSWDCYPPKGATFSEIAFNHTLMRGAREGQPWLLMEQTPSQQNWQTQCALKRPGVMRLWSYQAMAHGAEAIMYFQWRRTRGGIEKFHGAVVEHVGTSEPRVFREVAQLGTELEHLGTQTLGGRVPAQVAVLFDWENWWAVEYAVGPSRDLKYVSQCRQFFAALHEQGIACDIVSPEADLSKYKVVIAPVLYMIKGDRAQRLEEFVKGGGTFLTTFFSGIADECDSVLLGGYPGPLRQMLGIWAEEIDALRPEDFNSVVFEQPFGTVSGEIKCTLLCDIVHLEGAQALGVYGDDFYAGKPALTVNEFGQGRAYYLATSLEKAGLAAILSEICAREGVKPLLENVPFDVEVLTRASPDGTTLLYVLNHNASECEVPLPAGHYFDLLRNRDVSDSITLEKFGVAILRV